MAGGRRPTLSAMSHPPLPSAVRVAPGTDEEALWERFKVFEALHHRMQICNPMTGEDLSTLIETLAPADGDSMIDIACGHGELLLRVAEWWSIAGTGVDISPWALVHAVEAEAARALKGQIEWWLGDAHEFSKTPARTIATCLGGSWIWHGFEGTARAMADRVAPGGRIAVGDLQLGPGVDADEVRESYGAVMSRGDQAAALARVGISSVVEYPATTEAWDGYQARIEESATAWLEANPGPEAEKFFEEQARWQQDHARDREILTWTVWVGTVTG